MIASPHSAANATGRSPCSLRSGAGIQLAVLSSSQQTEAAGDAGDDGGEHDGHRQQIREMRADLDGAEIRVVAVQP
jgi:hypothetical protein